MSAEDAADFPTLAAHGIRWVQAYNFGPWPGNDVALDIAWAESYLDEAEASGLTVLANLHGRTRAEQGAALGDFSAFVGAIGDHPALGAWYLADEPEYSVEPPSLYDMEAVVRAARPDLPVQVAHCWCTDWWLFWEVGDVWMPDFYGIYADPDPSPNALYHPVFSSYHRTYYTESAIEPVMQGFSYAVYSDVDPVTYPPDSRFPTAAELRFWAFADLRGRRLRGVRLGERVGRLGPSAHPYSTTTRSPSVTISRGTSSRSSTSCRVITGKP